MRLGLQSASQDRDPAFLHHLASSGGTTITRELLSRTKTLVLNEINPFALPNQLFTPTDALNQLSLQVPIADKFAGQAFKDVMRTLDLIRPGGKALLVRIHSHSDYFPIYRGPRALALSNELSNVAAISVREPVANFASASRRGFIDLPLESYIERFEQYIEDHEGLPIFRFEDFLIDRDSIDNLVELLKLPKRKSYLSWDRLPRLSGDSSREMEFQGKSLKKVQTDLRNISEIHTESLSAKWCHRLDNLRDVLGYSRFF